MMPLYYMYVERAIQQNKPYDVRDMLVFRGVIVCCALVGMQLIIKTALHKRVSGQSGDGLSLVWLSWFDILQLAFEGHAQDLQEMVLDSMAQQAARAIADDGFYSYAESMLEGETIDSREM